MLQRLANRLFASLVYDPCARRGALPVGGPLARWFKHVGRYRQTAIEHDHPLRSIVGRKEWQSGWALSIPGLLWLWEHLQRVRPQRILEMGSGMSTLLFSLYASSHDSSTGEPLRIVTLEHEKQWLDETIARLNVLETRDRVMLIHCDLADVPQSGSQRKCYSVDLELIRNLFGGQGPQLVLIDGPPGAVGRHETLPILEDLLDGEVEVLLDDADRPGEQEVIAYWTERFRDRLQYKGTLPAGDGLAQFVYTGPSLRDSALVASQDRRLN